MNTALFRFAFMTLLIVIASFCFEELHRFTLGLAIYGVLNFWAGTFWANDLINSGNEKWLMFYRKPVAKREAHSTSGEQP